MGRSIVTGSKSGMVVPNGRQCRRWGNRTIPVRISKESIQSIEEILAGRKPKMSGLLFEIPSTPVNGQRVCLARELRSLTQAALGEILGIDQTMVAHIERGTKQPNSELLEAIATVLRLPPNFFRQPSPPDLPKGTLLFRAKAGLGK